MSFSDVFSTLMKVRRVVAIVSILAGTGYKVAPMVWHKADAKPALAGTPAANQIKARASGYDLGTVTLTNHYETSVPLGNGKACLLTPKMIDRRNVQLTLALESKTTAGKIQDLSVTQIITPAGKQFEVAVGKISLSLTPNIATE